MQAVILLFYLIFLCNSVVIETGYWYGNTRPPNVMYDSVNFANMTVKIDRPIQDGPGEHLVSDPLNPAIPLYVGNTINRQSFDTQFILDLSYSLGISTDRVYVTDVRRCEVHFGWESSSVIVNFIFLERNNNLEMTLLEAIALLTEQIQQSTSKLYIGTNVTLDIDPLWGLEVTRWDVSLKLSYPIEIVGGSAVQDGYYLNQGSLGACDYEYASNFSVYCEFERFFEDDVSRALNISYYRVQILFIKAAAPDQVLVHFRIAPPMPGTQEANVTAVIGTLMEQVSDQSSLLYLGNVTIRVDSTWGVSNTLPITRNKAAQFSRIYYDQDTSRLLDPERLTQITAYDRCKQNRRCNWGVVELDQSTNDARFFHRLFDRGTLFETNLFLDFEDWRMGTRGISWNGYIPPTARGKTSIPKARAADAVLRGAHFWPFDQPSLGPDIPCYLTERNQGLVLDRSLQRSQVDAQAALISDLNGRIQWLDDNIEIATMGADLRSRKDVRANLTFVQADFRQWWLNEIDELKQLNSSQCVVKDCFIQFNTSSLELTGAINDTGTIRTTSFGTEVAVFTFNSIYLGPEVEIRLVGQRALTLISKTSAVINTTFNVVPGTLGGFQGGGSVARYEADRFSDKPRSIYICDLGDYCATPRVETLPIQSNNVNGPGSGNLRVNPFVLETTATYVQEVQVIRTQAQSGQTLSGGFRLSFATYTTPLIPHDATAQLFKQILEENLNVVSPSSIVQVDRTTSGPAGIGVLNVTRSAPDSQEGFTWTVTFTTAVGDIDQMVVFSSLRGIGANVSIDTLRNGNEIEGNFSLDFQGYTTDPISAVETAAGLQAILLRVPIIVTADVSRIDPTSNCDDGLCANGPLRSKGYQWIIYVTTDLTEDNVSPTSPTSDAAQTVAPYYRFTSNAQNLTGLNVTISIYFGTTLARENPANLLDVTIPFSLAYGGAGGSYGGLGGTGYGPNPVGATYNDRRLTDLIAGSGGAMRTTNVYSVNSALGPTSGLGGHGGGAIEIIASNELTIGSYGKIIARGGDGEQSSGGGGGGGSGGAILLSSLSAIVMEGYLDVSGGGGGFGGFADLTISGGGGGGGRIAVYADSVTVPGTARVDGGACGVYKTFVPRNVTSYNISLYMRMLSPLDDDRIAFLGKEYIVSILSPLYAFSREVETSGLVNGTIAAILNVQVLLPRTSTFHATTLQADVTMALAVVNNTNIAQILMLSAEVTSVEASFINPLESTKTDACSNNGGSGTFFTEAKMTTSLYVREVPNGAAEGTKRALFFSNNENTNTSSGSAREAPFSWNGPIVPFEASQPVRITYYTKTDSVEGESTKSGFGSLFSLIGRGESGLNISSVIGVYFGSSIMHGANFGSAVDEKVFLKRMVTIDSYPILDRWYKIDIFIQWDNQTYSVRIDNRIVAEQQSFKGIDVDGFRISAFRTVDAWFDEIYIGIDNTMEFKCPVTTRRGTSTNAPVQRHWSFSEVHGGNSNGFTEYYKMTRHYNFLTTPGDVPFDGQGQVSDFQDIKLQYPEGDYPPTQGKVHAGALVYLTNSLRSAKSPLDQSKTLVSKSGLWSGVKDGIGGAGDGRQFWYTEFDFQSPLTATMNGGVAACSSQDMVSWSFEGIVMHYTNVSDMVHGRPGPFYVERPKVLFNPPTSNYVMWAVMDDSRRDLGMTAVATSPYEDGPFLFRRSFYPDGNQTRDQVIFLNEEGKTVLGRTYYQTVEFILPEAIMQPTWESAKSRAGLINFRANYQRAKYDIAYDNYNDIFDQRWRKEDQDYKVQCVDKITGVATDIPPGVYTAEGFVCRDPEETKVIFGQGNPAITSKFVSPNDTENSWWRPTSVPSVESQPWSNNYRDGFCGIRKLDDDFDVLDPNLVNFDPAPRNVCSNIADNPLHESLADKLIGVNRVVLTRRAKFIAISELTEDYLDTRGILNSFEGELESGDLISMIVEMGQFGFGAGSTVQSTFRPPVRSEFETAADYKTRFRQFIRNPNDRATYSLACVIDGVCPVNFRDQLTGGQF